MAEFLGLAPNSDLYESKLESAIIAHIQKFVMELGKGYAFVARQQHIRTDMGISILTWCSIIISSNASC